MPSGQKIIEAVISSLRFESEKKDTFPLFTLGVNSRFSKPLPVEYLKTPEIILSESMYPQDRR